MKRLLKLGLALTFALPSVVIGGDYILEINGKDIEMNLGEEIQVQSADGTKLKLTLRQKEFLTHAGKLFGFEHKNSFRPTTSDLGDGVFQTSIVTSLGTGLLIQEYMQDDPSALVQMMLHELTKEEVDYGYEYEEKEIVREVGGHTLKGKIAITKYQGDEWTREVVTLGKKDKGLLIVSFIEKANAEQDGELIKNFWKTLQINEALK